MNSGKDDGTPRKDVKRCSQFLLAPACLKDQLTGGYKVFRREIKGKAKEDGLLCNNVLQCTGCLLNSIKIKS